MPDFSNPYAWITFAVGAICWMFSGDKKSDATSSPTLWGRVLALFSRFQTKQAVATIEPKTTATDSLDLLERELGIVSADGSDPDLRQYRVKRINKALTAKPKGGDA